ncbi:MAG: hypothetical protein IK093_11425 [Ruminiclostridium sp.]|nr:hypothetical protein [Ruminiclostridium sp.]
MTILIDLAFFRTLFTAPITIFRSDIRKLGDPDRITEMLDGEPRVRLGEFEMIYGIDHIAILSEDICRVFETSRIEAVSPVNTTRGEEIQIYLKNKLRPVSVVFMSSADRNGFCAELASRYFIEDNNIFFDRDRVFTIIFLGSAPFTLVVCYIIAQLFAYGTLTPTELLTGLLAAVYLPVLIWLADRFSRTDKTKYEENKLKKSQKHKK